MSNKPKRNNYNSDVYKVYNNAQHNFLKNNKNFASLINYLLHLSISPDDLMDLDSKETVLFVDENNIEDNELKDLINISKELFRGDLIKRVNMKYDGKCIFVCIENQVKNEKNIMGRINLYNALTNIRPEVFADGHRIPVITILVGWGKHAFSHRYCFDDYNQTLVKKYGLKRFLPYYEVPVFNIKDISEEDMNKFPDEMRAMIMIIKMSTGKVKDIKRNEYMEEVKRMLRKEEIGIEAKQLGAVYLGLGNGEKIMKDGIAEYWEDFAAENKEIGKAEGKTEERAYSIRSLMKNMNWSFDNAANALGIPLNERNDIKSYI